MCYTGSFVRYSVFKLFGRVESVVQEARYEY